MLVAISIPIFSSQLEKSREAVDLSNIRAAYAEVMTSALTEDTTPTNDVKYTATNTWSKDVTLVQTIDDWQSNVTDVKIGEVSLANSKPTAKGKATVKCVIGTDGTSTVTVDFN